MNQISSFRFTKIKLADFVDKFSVRPIRRADGTTATGQFVELSVKRDGFSNGIFRQPFFLLSVDSFRSLEIFSVTFFLLGS